MLGLSRGDWTSGTNDQSPRDKPDKSASFRDLRLLDVVHRGTTMCITANSLKINTKPPKTNMLILTRGN